MLSFQYLFTAPVFMDTYTIVFMVLFGLYLISGIVWKVAKNILNDKAFKKEIGPIIQTSFTFGIIGYVFIFFIYQNAMFFSTRIWLILTFAVSVFFAYRSIKKFLNGYNRRKENARRYSAK